MRTWEPRSDEEAAEMDEVHRVHNHLQRMQDERERQLQLARAELATASRSVRGDATGYYAARVKRLQREIADMERMGR